MTENGQMSVPTRTFNCEASIPCIKCTPSEKSIRQRSVLEAVAVDGLSFFTERIWTTGCRLVDWQGPTGAADSD